MASHPEKQEDPMVVTLLGMTTDWSAVHSLNSPSSIVIYPGFSGSLTETSPEPKNALLAMLDTESGMYNDLSE